jgi:hypothetical protein
MDGLSVGISLSFQFKIKDNVDEVYSLYIKYGVVCKYL